MIELNFIVGLLWIIVMFLIMLIIIGLFIYNRMVIGFNELIKGLSYLLKQGGDK